MRDYHHTYLIQFRSRKAKLLRGAESPPQVENVLNRQGEIGLILYSMDIFRNVKVWRGRGGG